MSRKKHRQHDKKKPTAGAVELTESELEHAQGGLLPAVKPATSDLRPGSGGPQLQEKVQAENRQ